jgi:hypothetical protein
MSCSMVLVRENFAYSLPSGLRQKVSIGIICVGHVKVRRNGGDSQVDPSALRG